MIPLQLVSVLFGLFMIYFVRLHYRKNHIEKFEYSVWVLLWIVFTFLAIFPQTFQGLVQELRISRVFDLLNIIALMILAFLVFHGAIKSREFEHKLEDLIRRKALDDMKPPVERTKTRSR